MINLSNYEEYFLLYIDNELNEEERTAIEAFVLLHPHLAAELDMLQETKLPLEATVEFVDKNTLYKAADNSININNYEEYFLLHTDKELPAHQEREVEQFVLQHPQLQEEFLLLQKAKLAPEAITCPNKHRLYKQPAKRIIPLYITKMAVAAAVAGVIMLIGNIVINNRQQPQVAINTELKKQQTVENNSPVQKEPDVALPQKKSNAIIVAKNDAKRAAVIPVKSDETGNKQTVPSYKKQNEEAQVEVQIEPVQIKQPAPPAPDAAIANNNVALKQEQATALKPLEEADEKDAASTVMYASNEYTTARPAVYKELNTDEDEQTQTLYVGSLQLNKAKVNGLLKKATHLLGGKAKESNL